jgi:murein DD-endopeptidase MepM/ murein hydrolase activator NlpD
MRVVPALLLAALVLAAGMALGQEGAHAGEAVVVVEAGDTLIAIARRYNTTVAEIKLANGLTSDVIRVGQTLRVPLAVGGPGAAPILPPGVRVVTLERGQTLWSIGQRYGLSIETLVGGNPSLASLDTVPVGTRLFILPAPGILIQLGAGENLLTVAHDYPVRPQDLLQANGITDLAAGRGEGDFVFIPGVVPLEKLAELEEVRRQEQARRAEEARRQAAALAERMRRDAARVAEILKGYRPPSEDMIWPVSGRITSGFGYRRLWVGGTNFHAGIDVAAPLGTPVRAARSGVVSVAGWIPGGYGNTIYLEHGSGLQTRYAHLARNVVAVGDRVSQGQVIGYLGNTGLSTGPHLHFEVRENAVARDPLRWLP